MVVNSDSHRFFTWNITSRTAISLTIISWKEKKCQGREKNESNNIDYRDYHNSGVTFFINYYKRRYSNMEINFSKDKQGSKQADLHVHLKIDIKIMDR